MHENRLGIYLRDRRTRLDPAMLGFAAGRRRTPGLRREEVAQRAHISPTWYTWLEQGRGGAPSTDVLNRIARALMLTDVEREHLFLLALGHPPEVRYQASGDITPRLQRVLDAFGNSPALIKTLTWDVVAWNRAATVVLSDFAALPAERRNILRRLFSDARVRDAQHDWESVARFVVAAFRADVTRAGATTQVSALVAELSATSADFARLWADNDVRYYGGGEKHMRHPVLGQIAFEYSAFAVDGQPDLGLIVYNPATAEDAARIDAMLHPECDQPPGFFAQ